MYKFDQKYQELLESLDVDYTKERREMVDVMIHRIMSMPNDDSIPEQIRDDARTALKIINNPSDFELDPVVELVLQSVTGAAAHYDIEKKYDVKSSLGKKVLYNRLQAEYLAALKAHLTQHN